nr:YraN family protein [Streptomyces boluensis]
MKILARNWRSGPGGEIDIVALDHDTLVICEVKTRRGRPDHTGHTDRTGRTGRTDHADRTGHADRTDHAGRSDRTGPVPVPPFQHPMAAITPAKADRLRTLAERWLHHNGGPPPGGVRIDLIGILLPSRGAPFVEHAQGVA